MAMLSLPRLPRSVMPGGMTGLVFLLPPVLGLLAKLWRSRRWFGDYQAVACAGQKVLAHQPVYDFGLNCGGMHASVYVYIPAVAQFAAFCQKLIGGDGFFFLYLLLFALSVGGLIFVPLLSKAAPGIWRDKLPFTVFLSGSAIMWGNIAVILHAATMMAALVLETAPWLFVAAVVVAAWVKPVFLTYLIVALIADMPPARRAAMAVSGVAAGLLPTFVYMTIGGDEARAWFTVLSHFVYVQTPGYGVLGWLADAGIHGDGVVAKAVYLVYAFALGLSGVIVAEGLRLDGRSRLWLGLTLAALMIPRIMSQDMFLLGPGLWLLARTAAERLDGGLARQAPALMLILCGVALLGGLTGTGSWLIPAALAGLGGMIVALAWVTVRDRVSHFSAFALAWLRRDQRQATE